jgi:serine/threonine-protein kinase RsbW
MSDPVVRLTFPAKPDYLLLARLALSGVGRTAPVSEEVLADLKLAITEACGNSVRHAYQEGAGEVSVAYALEPGAIELIVEDQGTGLEPDAVNATTGPGEGGMGMSIIRAVVDELEVSSGADGRGTVVRMTKLLTEPDART